MLYLLNLSLLLQGIVMIFDEGYFHHQRGLPRWERIGHPIDTLTFLSCIAFATFYPFSYSALKIYALLAIFSCIMVTKDEFTHKHHCRAAENWTHALLFILHPLCLVSIALLWLATSVDINVIPSFLKALDPFVISSLLYLQTAFITLFLIYQIIYWNFIWQGEEKRL